MIGEIGLVTDSEELGWEASFIALIYLFELRKISFIRYRRINFFIDETEVPANVFGTDTKVCNVGLPYKFQFYAALKTEEERKNEILGIFDKGFMILCEKLDWDKEVFSNIRKMILEKNFRVEIIVGKRRSNKSKDKVSATLSVVPLMNKYEYYVNFERGGQIFCSLLIYEGMPSWIYWDRLFNQLKWIDNEEFVVMDDYDEILFKCRYKECKFELGFAPKEHEIKDMKKKLKFWYCETSHEERMKMTMPPINSKRV